MADTIIRVENLSKKYLIKHQQQSSYTVLRDVIADKVKSLSKRIISPCNHKQSSTYSTTEEFWAIKDISFKVKQGEVIGIIGRNGAGKSTLLKIISQITEPTKGRICINGRVASLLEVGTGFHPELTGRENIFLNGAILGMGKAEIKRKFDEIVAFAEIEKFLDTPVKRYSSGMYVRLAFAVAAHLEPDILLVDEVLAVGDAQFQQKCLGKMEDVGRAGRTVLFVSHNMSSILQLTSRVVLLEKGCVLLDAESDKCVKEYLSIFANRNRVGKIQTSNPSLSIAQFSFLSREIENGFNKTLKFKLKFIVNSKIRNITLLIAFINTIGARILTTKANIEELNPGAHGLYLDINDHRLTPGNYSINLGISVQEDIIFNDVNVIGIEVTSNCIDEPLLLPHISRGGDKIGAFCPIIISNKRKKCKELC